MQGQASAPGKVIISGEHSVVYGHPALVMAINRRLVCTFACSESEKLIVTVDGAEVTGDETKLVDYISSKFESVPALRIEITVNSEIPSGAGLGSSAAFGAAFSQVIYGCLCKHLNF